eukprot:11228736-Ditylum_brightwellii.AAC.1
MEHSVNVFVDTALSEPCEGRPFHHVGIDSSREEVHSSIHKLLNNHVSFYCFGVLAIVLCSDFIGARCTSPFQHFFACMEGECVICLCVQFTSRCWGTQD